jgi:hypothetical protein
MSDDEKAEDVERDRDANGDAKAAQPSQYGKLVQHGCPVFATDNINHPLNRPQRVRDN